VVMSRQAKCGRCRRRPAGKGFGEYSDPRVFVYESLRVEYESIRVLVYQYWQATWSNPNWVVDDQRKQQFSEHCTLYLVGSSIHQSAIQCNVCQAPLILRVTGVP
jgi:hypothetical protein